MNYPFRNIIARALSVNTLCLPMLFALLGGTSLALLTYPKSHISQKHAAKTAYEILAAYNESTPASIPPALADIEQTGRIMFQLPETSAQEAHPQGGFVVTRKNRRQIVWESAQIQVTPGEKYILTYDMVPYDSDLYIYIAGKTITPYHKVPPMYVGIKQFQFAPADEQVSIQLVSTQFMTKNIAWIRDMKIGISNGN